MKLTKKSTLMRKSWREWTNEKFPFCGTGLPLTFSDLKVYCRFPENYKSEKSYFYYNPDIDIYVYDRTG